MAERAAEHVALLQHRVLHDCIQDHLEEPTRTEDKVFLKILSSLMANSARPSASDLKELSHFYASGNLFKNCCLRAVTSAANPFIPGLTLSIRLGEAATLASEGEKRTIAETKSSIDELLREIFERLPHTVRGFEDEEGMDACAGIFEPGPTSTKGELRGLGGPLDMIISQERQLEMFCKVPLVMDFLSSKFTMGLPDPIDTAGLLKNKNQLRYLEENGLFRDESQNRRFDAGQLLPRVAVALLQGVDPVALSPETLDPPSLTFMPGAQFIVAGMVAAPTDYYEVPAMRMLLDFVVYVGMVALLSFFVLFHSTAGSIPGDDSIVDHSFSSTEGAWALIFITVSV